MNRTITLNGEAALVVKYAFELARVRYPEFSSMSDDAVLSKLIDMGVDNSRELEA